MLLMKIARMAIVAGFIVLVLRTNIISITIITTIRIRITDNNNKITIVMINDL